MAGAGFRTFADGEVLTAALVQNYLQDQAVMVFADSTARDAAIGTAVVSEGMFTYLADTDTLEFYSGSSWVPFSAGAKGGGADQVFYENVTAVTASYSITSGANAMTAGPISIGTAATVTVPAGSVWTIV